MEQKSNGDMFALVDCNNFYVSCERIFNPKLENKPVLILSSNDGCIVARSNEAKALGFKMGEPIFQRRDLVIKYRVIVLSSNFELYGDISSRVMTLLKKFSPDYEEYSIDEMFLNLQGFTPEKLKTYAKEIREHIWQGLHIPVSIGIGSSKTLAKAANFFAKKFPLYEGVCLLEKSTHLDKIPIREVWGVGRRLSEKLTDLGIINAKDLSNANLSMIRSKFGVVLTRTALELQGTPCLEINEITAKKSIIVSRSFGQKISSYQEIRTALATFATRASEKLRENNSYASALMVFIDANHFDHSVHLKFAYPTNDTSIILKKAQEGLKAIFKEGFQYRKTGIMLLDITPQNIQTDLFVNGDINNSRLMTIIDSINKKFGRRTLQYAICEGKGNAWQPKKNLITPAYTTRWEDILTVQAR